VARSTELGECIAKVLGIRPTTAASHVRNLREAGLLTKTGRGITGAHMTPLDAAHLLIAATCSQDVQDSADTVDRYGKLIRIGGAIQQEDFPALAALGAGHKFIDALATLLGEGNQFLADDRQSTVVVTFTDINQEVLLDGSTHQRRFAGIYRTAGQTRRSPALRVPNRDLQIMYRFTEQTIFAIGDLLRGGS
jgi:hypothetical protein